MCRFLIVKAIEPILLADLTTRPSHSIIHQSRDARLRLDGGGLNADGVRRLGSTGTMFLPPLMYAQFGIGWYDADDQRAPDEPNTPCEFKAITPAWSNRNLHQLVEKIRSPLVFAHVRASTTGQLSEQNCHPWVYGSLMWMHNGGIADFTSKIKRKLQAVLEDEFFHVPQGNTDSEWAFALFLQLLSSHADPRATDFSHKVLRETMMQTISQLNQFSKDAGVSEPSLLNFAVTDGKSVVATRYVSSRDDQAASLYFSTGTTFSEWEAGSGCYRMRKVDKREHIILIASEPLTFVRDDWLEVGNQTCIVITPQMNLLQYPIFDEFHDSDARDHGLAASKGLYHFDHPKPVSTTA